jgi:anthranilate synthase/aminodeoxychorismate synthase-like glutamine amidotransferase
MLLVFDNYDSFVYNLARYFAQVGWNYKVVRNNAITLNDIETMNPEAIILSPGPCSPKEAGICVDVVKNFGPTIPILGVCLGHQCVGEAYGAKTIRADAPVHGKASTIRHDGTDIFENLPQHIEVGRYHSLIVEPQENSPLMITARSAGQEIMAMRHSIYPVYGVQFHPESVLTPHGAQMVKNFTAITKNWHKSKRVAA